MMIRLTVMLSVMMLVPFRLQAQEPDIGKLFTDPAERARMEAYRSGDQAKEAVKKPSVSTVRVDGVMIRSDGENVIWINGNNTLNGSSTNGVRTYPDAVDSRNMEVPVRVNGRRFDIKPGQYWTEGSGKVSDNY